MRRNIDNPGGHNQWFYSSKQKIFSRPLPEWTRGREQRRDPHPHKKTLASVIKFRAALNDSREKGPRRRQDTLAARPCILRCDKRGSGDFHRAQQMDRRYFARSRWIAASHIPARAPTQSLAPALYVRKGRRPKGLALFRRVAKSQTFHARHGLRSGKCGQDQRPQRLPRPNRDAVAMAAKYRNPAQFGCWRNAAMPEILYPPT